LEWGNIFSLASSLAWSLIKNKMNTNWTYLKWRYVKLQKRIIRAVCSKIYRDTNHDTGKSIMVAGTGRSGTTWLANIIASQMPGRIMFEPFQSYKVKAFSQFHYFQYMRPTEQNTKLFLYSKNIFSGNIRHSWIDRQVEHIRPQYRIVKAIRANLFLQWLQIHFPEVPLLFVIRHPCAVALSRMQLDWATDTDIAPFLAQPKLVDDFLADKMDIINKAKTEEEKHAVIWCISHLVPLKQFQANTLNVVFYENLSTQPNVEIPRIFQLIKHSYQETVFDYINQPSTTTIKSSAIVTGADKITQWQQKLSPKQINNILAVVRGFGLDYLYDDSGMPLVTNFNQMMDYE